MIPLRVVHIVPARRQAAATLVAETIARHLHGLGHAQALALPAACCAGAPPGVDVIPWQDAPLRWLLGGRDRLLRALAMWSPDLIHVHEPALLRRTLAVARRMRLPVVATLCGGWERPGARLLADPRIARALVPTDEHRADGVARFGLARERVAILPAPGAAHPGGRATDGRLVVGSMAGDARSRAVDTCLAALARVRRSGVVARGVLAVDDARAAERTLAAARRLGIAEHIVPLVDAPPADLVRRCDVVLAPGPEEPCPLLLAEAQAAGRPVVAAALGGAGELIRAGESGLLIPSGGVEAADAALCEVADAARRAAMGAHGRRLAAERYAPPLIAGAALELYRGALADRTSAGRLASSSAYRRAATRSRTAATSPGRLPAAEAGRPAVHDG